MHIQISNTSIQRQTGDKHNTSDYNTYERIYACRHTDYQIQKHAYEHLRHIDTF